MVQLVQIDVAQQRTEHRALRCACLGRPTQAVQDFGLQKRSINASTRPSAIRSFGEPSVVRAESCRSSSSGRHPPHNVAVLQQPIDSPQGVLAAASGAKAVAVLGELPLEDRLQDVRNGALHHAVSHRGDAQRPRLCVPGFGMLRAAPPAAVGSSRNCCASFGILPTFGREFLAPSHDPLPPPPLAATCTAPHQVRRRKPYPSS